MMRTISQLRKASQIINTAPIRPGLQYLLSTWLLRHPSRVNDRTRLLHQIKHRSVPSITAAWKEQWIDYYSTAYVGYVRLTTADSSRKRRSDDSSIIVKLDGVEHFAVTEEIFCINGTENFLMVLCLMNGEPFGCSLETGRFSFPNIQRGSMDNPRFVPLDHFVEKCVRVGPSSASDVIFIRFPNLCGSSWIERPCNLTTCILDDS